MVTFNKFIKIKDTQYEVIGVSTITNPQNNTLVFIQKKYESSLINLKRAKGCTVIAEKGIQISDDLKAHHNFMTTSNPRLMFTKVYRQLAEEEERNRNCYSYQNINGAIVSENAKIGKNVIIEPFCFIDHGAVIGNNTIIRTGTKIRSRVIIGNNCIIKENAVIGTPGFSFEKDEGGNFIRVPQLGGVILFDNVEVGALATIGSGTIEPTILNEQVKIMDHAHIAHNVVVGRQTIVGSGTTIAGSVKIGQNVWIAPNCAIMHMVKIGDGSVIGLSSRVHKSVPSGTTVINEGAESFDYVMEFIKLKEKMVGDVDVNDTSKYGRGHPYFK